MRETMDTQMEKEYMKGGEFLIADSDDRDLYA